MEMGRQSKVPERNRKIKSQGLVGNEHVQSLKPVPTFFASGETSSSSERETRLQVQSPLLPWEPPESL